MYTLTLTMWVMSWRFAVILSCRNLHFKDTLSQQRIKNACDIFGENVVKRVISFSLYLLGVNRSAIGIAMNLPVDSVKSIIKAIHHDGISAFEDRRRKLSTFLPQRPIRPGCINVRREGEQIFVDFGDNLILQLPHNNTIQIRTVLLSLLNSGLLSVKSISEVLMLTEVHTRNLAEKLKSSDAIGLADQRIGQRKEYRFDGEVKSELIQQYAAHAITGESTASIALTKGLNSRLNWKLADRTVRHHIQKLGLHRIAHSLPLLIQALKKL
jgi:hypothetical protein